MFHSDYTVGCDAHPGLARQGRQALLTLRGPRRERRLGRADSGGPRPGCYRRLPRPIPRGHARRAGDRGQLVLDRR